MKTYRRFIAMLLAGVLFLSCVPAHAMTSAEKENKYAAAIMELETYLESSGNSSADLAGIESTFRELGGYEQSRFLRYYVAVLMKIADEEYDFQLNTYLDMLEADEDFQKYLEDSLKGSSIKSVDKLKAYAAARKYEHEGRIAEAMEEYRKCLNFFGADERYTSLMEARYKRGYERAMELLKSDDYAAAYFQFSELSGYSDSKQWMDSIVRQIGYTPSSPTDNLEPVTGLKVTNIRITEITLSWNKSYHAASYEVYYKINNSDNWIDAGSVNGTTKTFSGLEQGTSYDFKVVAAIGHLKANEAILTNQKTAGVTSTSKPKPTPTCTPTPKPLSIKSTQKLGRQRYVAAGDQFTIGILNDGTCISTGYSPDVSTWKDIIYICASQSQVAGIKSNGSVVCTDTSFPIKSWQNIIMLEYGSNDYFPPFDEHLVGLQRDGKVFSCGTNNYGECNTDDWQNIVDISAGSFHTVGLRADGTVVATGDNTHGQCDIGNWNNIVDVAAAQYSTYGLTSDGRIVMAGNGTSEKGRTPRHEPMWDDLAKWEDIVAIMAGYEAGMGYDYVIGIRKDGTIISNLSVYVTNEEIASFSDVVSVARASWGYIIVSNSKGEVFDIGWDADGHRNTTNWKKIKTLDN